MKIQELFQQLIHQAETEGVDTHATEKMTLIPNQKRLILRSGRSAHMVGLLSDIEKEKYQNRLQIIGGPNSKSINLGMSIGYQFSETFWCPGIGRCTPAKDSAWIEEAGIVFTDYKKINSQTISFEGRAVFNTSVTCHVCWCRECDGAGHSVHGEYNHHERAGWIVSISSAQNN